MSDGRETLSNEIVLLRVVAAALGIGQKTFEGVNRVLLGRSLRGETVDLEKLRKVHAAVMDGVLRYFRRAGSAGGGGANEFSDFMLMSALRIYPRVCRALCSNAPPSPLHVRLVIEEVLVPTAFALMLSRSPFAPVRMISSLGHEFDGPLSWYLPEDGRAFCAVWERWLRVTGFRTPCGFSRDSAALKDQGQRWLKGETLPSIEDIDRVVKKYAERVEWLDGARAWQARLRLSRALQYFRQRETEHAREHALPPPPVFRAQFEQINSDRVLCDPDEWLASPSIFFAVRLIQRRIIREGRFGSILTGPEKISRTFSPRVSDDAIAKMQARDHRRLSPGYRLLRYLAKRGRVPLGPAFSSPPNWARSAFEAAVVRLGLEELRTLAREKAAGC